MSTEKSRIKKDVKTKMKAKYKAKVKRIRRFKRGVALVVSTMVLCTGAFGALIYCFMNFKGEVKDKYQSGAAMGDVLVGTNHILVKTWFGEKDFCVDDATYNQVEVGQTYSFRKNTGNDWVKVQPRPVKELEEV